MLDFKNLKRIIKNSYLDSRYYYDKNFSINKIKNFYYGWLKKGIQGRFDDICYVICLNKKPIGFCTCKINLENNPKIGSIGLLGIQKKFQGKGYSRLLLNYVEKKLLQLNKQSIKVITQGRNYAAIKTYNNYGFSIKKTELWYHKWIN
jgi:ribosomal protein S18 acetylase RimI-like enzyme